MRRVHGQSRSILERVLDPHTTSCHSPDRSYAPTRDVVTLLAMVSAFAYRAPLNTFGGLWPTVSPSYGLMGSRFTSWASRTFSGLQHLAARNRRAAPSRSDCRTAARSGLRRLEWWSCTDLSGEPADRLARGNREGAFFDDQAQARRGAGRSASLTLGQS